MSRYALASGLTLALALTLSADDWPQWLGPKRDGVWREAGVVETLPAGGPKELWRVPVGVGYSGPAVTQGKVFVTDLVPAAGAKLPESGFAKNVRVPANERVLCLDEKTGKELWKHEYPVEYTISYAAGPRCTPAIDGDRVYSLGAMGHLVCLDVATGTPVWSKNFIQDYDAALPVWGFAAHPLVDGDKLICLVGGTESRLVVAFDKKTGKQLWAAESCAGDFGYCPPVIYEFGGKRQLIVWHTKAVLGLEPDTGKRIWRADFEAKYALTAPMPRKVGDDQLFVTSFYNGSMLLKVTADKAAVVWKSKARGEMPAQTTDLSSIMPTPVIDGDYTYGVCSYGQLRCIKTATGERVWETMKATRGALTPAKVAADDEPATTERWSNAFLVKHEDRYFLFNEQGDLIVARLSPKGYEELSRAHLIDPTNVMAGNGRKVVWMHPAFADKCVFVRNDKELVCYSLAK
jgi:outer membrane protein assembly factor BamB